MGAALGPILLGLQVASNISSTRQQYKSQQRAYEQQAQVARQNMAIAQRQREQSADNYAQKQSQLNDKMRLLRGKAAAAAGASGLTYDGSVNDVMDSSYEAYEKDSMNLLSNQRNDSWSRFVDVVNYNNQAISYDNAARNVRKQGHQAIFGTLLGAAATAYGQGWIGGSGSNSGVTKLYDNSNWFKTGVSNIMNIGNEYSDVYKGLSTGNIGYDMNNYGFFNTKTNTKFWQPKLGF